ncbi:hypothetical protein AVEN_187771-1 [Araneus ventricosus]|uniref:Uncharacterized protein n=1 Tax=Araneus ventricosus TaxID=182803 RepID=A0A4Y2C557_ARAVE|nr:hypothetical protein AVEN_187771-1 [Araneus ventricosus]
MAGSCQAWIPDLGDKLGNLATNLVTLATNLGPRSEFFQMTPSDVTTCRGDYKRTVPASQSSSVLIDFERVDRQERTLEFRLQCEWKAGELSAIESVVIVIISD